MNPQLRPLISKEEIAAEIQNAAHRISADYKGKNLTIVVVLKGAICLAADLIRSLQIPFELEVVQCSSYGSRGAARGELEIHGLDRLRLTDRDLLIVDDIFDSGHTLDRLAHALQQKHPRSIKSCVLLKKTVPHSTSHRPDYILFSIDNLFVVGYGLDYKEHYRGLPGIYVLEGAE